MIGNYKMLGVEELTDQPVYEKPSEIKRRARLRAERRALNARRAV
jgi:ribosomal protein S21